ncbi:MAG: hypothetical protein R6V10_07550 [bacterium]
MVNCKKRLSLLASGAVLLLAAVVAASGVVAALTDSERKKGFDFSSIDRVAFLAMTRVESDNDKMTSCPVRRGRHPACDIADHAESELSRLVAHALYGSSIEVEWIEQSRMNEARAKLKKEGRPELTRYGSWQRAIGKELQADAVLFGFIYCYRERKGTAYASAEPAALSFCLHLVDPESGEILWTFTYEDEQKALFENLLNLPEFIERGCKWIPVEQMAREAARKVVEKTPFPRQEKTAQESGGR